MADSIDRFTGCLLGLALGDARGAPAEGGPLERAVWRVVGRTREGRWRWTDDTQMSLDLADSLIARGGLDQDDVASRFAASYRWSRGYGPGAATVLKRVRRGIPWEEASHSVYPGGSYGNGGAMRSPVIGMFFAPHEPEMLAAAAAAARVTHAHRLGVAGAVIVAGATSDALRNTDPADVLARAEAVARRCDGPEFATRLALARQWAARAEPPSPREVRRQLGNGAAAIDSCVTALYLASRVLASAVPRDRDVRDRDRRRRGYDLRDRRCVVGSRQRRACVAGRLAGPPRRS